MLVEKVISPPLSLTEPNLLPFYASVVQQGNLRVLVYNGDTDPGINSFVTQDKYTEYFDSQVRGCMVQDHGDAFLKCDRPLGRTSPLPTTGARGPWMARCENGWTVFLLLDIHGSSRQAEMGGYVLQYGKNFHYLTIRGSGHMVRGFCCTLSIISLAHDPSCQVPEFKPPAALVFLQNFLAGQDYPTYNPPNPPPSARRR